VSEEKLSRISRFGLLAFKVGLNKVLDLIVPVIVATRVVLLLVPISV